ncbi:hypothetical protein SDC9_91981 [bioreactor metagenome]|uniref:Uncharacterized protein n=1 Tax=bioreactor metagenome TaxID=1076179 RepID=A0A644ZWI2_9ZZZZ
MTVDDVLFKDLECVFRFDLHVEHVLREDLDDGTFFAKTKAAGNGSINLPLQAVVGDETLKVICDLLAFRSMAARTTADEDHDGLIIDLSSQASAK